MRTSRVVCTMAAMTLAVMTTLTVLPGCGEQAGPGGAQQAKAPSPAPAASAVLEALAKRLGVPAARVPVVSKAPVVDGVMDDVYRQATPLTFKFLAGGQGKPTAPTTVRVVSTKKVLYMFFKCETPDMDAILEDVREHDGPVWDDDCVEIFIDPTNRRQADTYMHLGVSANGTTMEAKGPKGNEDYSWDPKLTVKTAKQKKAWTVELAIPFSELVPNPARMNKVWAVNFNRMAYLIEGTEDTAWSPTGGTDSHVPGKFGVLWLDAGTVDNSK